MKTVLFIFYCFSCIFPIFLNFILLLSMFGQFIKKTPTTFADRINLMKQKPLTIKAYVLYPFFLYTLAFLYHYFPLRW